MKVKRKRNNVKNDVGKGFNLVNENFALSLNEDKKRASWIGEHLKLKCVRRDASSWPVTSRTTGWDTNGVCVDGITARSSEPKMSISCGCPWPMRFLIKAERNRALVIVTDLTSVHSEPKCSTQRRFLSTSHAVIIMALSRSFTMKTRRLCLLCIVFLTFLFPHSLDASFYNWNDLVELMREYEKAVRQAPSPATEANRPCLMECQRNFSECLKGGADSATLRNQIRTKC